MTDREQHSETIIQDYLDDRLSAVDRQQVDEQLATDPQAQQELEELRIIGSALRELPAHQLGDDFVDEVMVGLAENRNLADLPAARVVTSRYSPGRLQRLVVTWGSAIAAMLVLAVGIGMLIGVFSDPGQPPGGTIADGNLPGDNAPAVPDEVQQPDESIVPGTTNVDALVADKLLFVMEIGLTGKGVQSKVIDRVLMKHGIVFDESIQVDMDMETELLENRFLDGIVSKPSDPKSGNQQVELIYVVCSGLQVDRMSMDLHNYQGEVAAYRFNLAIMPGDAGAFGRLEKAIAAQWKPDTPVEPEKPALADFRNRAGRLMMDLVLISGMGRSLSNSILSSGNDIPDLPDDASRRKPVKPPQPGVARIGDDLVCEILLIVRRMSKEEIEKGAP
ncbi:MAG: hypothetical protein VB817_08445 [Pirellulaceae bacterium]